VLLRDYLDKHASAGVTFVIPQYWTNEHRRALEDVCKMANIDLTTIVEDFTTLCLLYGSEKAAKHGEKPHHVLFVDIGGTSVKAYSGLFTVDHGIAHVVQTGISWSEKAGGYFFAKRIAANDGVTVKKAEKVLMTESASYDFGKVLAGELAEIRRVISRAVGLATALRPLDEVQIIGGASKFAFVRNTIAASVGDVPVLREFNAQEALALGGVLAAMTVSDLETARQTYVHRISAWNMTIICGTNIEYCRDNTICQETVDDRSTGCDVLRIVGPREQIPDGLTDVLGEFHLVNISNIRFGDTSEAVGHISLVSPDAVLRRVSWCNGETCYPIEIEVNRGPEYLEERAELAEWLKRYVELQKEEHERLKNIDKIGDELKKLTLLVLPEYSEGGGTFPFPSEAKDQFRQILDDYNSGQIMSYSAPNVKDAIDYLMALESQIRSVLH
jgi:hypothetical protein